MNVDVEPTFLLIYAWKLIYLYAKIENGKSRKSCCIAHVHCSFVQPQIKIITKYKWFLMRLIKNLKSPQIYFNFEPNFKFLHWHKAFKSVHIYFIRKAKSILLQTLSMCGSRTHLNSYWNTESVLQTANFIMRYHIECL